MLSSAKILRQYASDKVVIANGASVSADCPRFPEFAGGVIFVPSAWTAADITFEFGTRDMIGTVTWSKLRDKTGVLVRITGITVSSYHEIPAQAFMNGPLTVRLVSTNTASEAAVNQGAERTLYIYLKS